MTLGQEKKAALLIFLFYSITWCKSIAYVTSTAISYQNNNI